MKHFTRHIAYVLVATAMLFYTACSKDGSQGPAGPPGEAGSAGANGAPGAAGAAGPKGDTGVANIIYSDWLDVGYLPDTTTANGPLDTLGWYSQVAAPKLSKTILSTGEVKVYWNLNTAADPIIVPLPYVSTYFENIQFAAMVQGIQFYSNFNAGTAQDQQGLKYGQYRYILIPGGVAARSAGGVDWKDYKQVKKYLGLKD
ncbi:hypothetical protein [Chitinophaga sp. MM2321]|uniref:hypothetical protein n=1 Tax=Chitinophaga sp. MM2321 TaxID=3137178 RepID=UPI0032D58A3E